MRDPKVLDRRDENPYYRYGFDNPVEDTFSEKRSIDWATVTKGWDPLSRDRMSRFAICERCGQKKDESRQNRSGLCIRCESETACRHRCSIMDDECKAGVRVREVFGDAPGIILRLPCSYTPGGSPMACDRFEPQTVAEIREEDAGADVAIARFMTTQSLIASVKKDHKGTDWCGEKECPVCQGTLHMSHAAYNGHVHGRCETEGCLAWME